MKVNEFRKLEKKITNQDFNKSYKNINMIMIVLSYFGHIASIFLAYFMLSKILSESMTDNKVAVFIASVIILGGLEALKRDIFDKFSIEYLKQRAFNKGVLPLFLLSTTIIGTSFYVSINGAKEFSSKNETIEKETKNVIGLYKDSVTKEFNSVILPIEEEIKLYKTDRKIKDDEQALLAKSIQENGKLNPSQKLRNTQLSEEKKDLDSKIKVDEDKIAGIKLELENNIKEHESLQIEESKEKQDKSGKNSFSFVIISTLIEIVILAGVYFSEYYKFRSYREYREKIEKDPNFQKWMLYDQILSIIYTEDTKMNQKLPSNKAMIDICKVNDIIVMPKDMIDFLKTMSNLGVIKTTGSTRYISKQRDLAFEILSKHFKIE